MHRIICICWRPCQSVCVHWVFAWVRARLNIHLVWMQFVPKKFVENEQQKAEESNFAICQPMRKTTILPGTEETLARSINCNLFARCQQTLAGRNCYDNCPSTEQPDRLWFIGRNYFPITIFVVYLITRFQSEVGGQDTDEPLSRWAHRNNGRSQQWPKAWRGIGQLIESSLIRTLGIGIELIPSWMESKIIKLTKMRKREDRNKWFYFFHAVAAPVCVFVALPHGRPHYDRLWLD